MTDTAGATQSIVEERMMPHPPEKVWRALTQPALIAQWLMQNDFEPKVGHRFSFRAQPQPGWSGVVNCEVKIVEPLRRLVYTWGDGTDIRRRLEDGRDMDARAGGRRHAPAHGAVGLPPRRRGQLPGRGLRLAPVSRGPGARDRRAARGVERLGRGSRTADVVRQPFLRANLYRCRLAPTSGYGALPICCRIGAHFRCSL